MNSNQIIRLRRRLQNQGEPPAYIPARMVSIYVTRLLYRFDVSPDFVTLVWIVVLICASVCFGFATPLGNWMAALLIAVYYVLDCVDGELARLYRTSSKIGSQLEQVGHWLTHGLLIVGLAYGASRTQDGSWWWTVGAASLIGDYTFHFVYFTIHLGFDRTLSYGFLHRLTRSMYLLMPINTNLFLAGALLDRPEYALSAWCIVANIAWPIVFVQYYRVENRRKKMRA